MPWWDDFPRLNVDNKRYDLLGENEGEEGKNKNKNGSALYPDCSRYIPTYPENRLSPLKVPACIYGNKSGKLVVKKQKPGWVYFGTDLNSLPWRAGWLAAH